MVDIITASFIEWYPISRLHRKKLIYHYQLPYISISFANGKYRHRLWV